MKILLGHDMTTKRPVWIPDESFRTHWHYVGGTGKGKTTMLEAIIHQLLMCPFFSAHFVFCRLGGLSQSLMMWLSSSYCPQAIRERVIYIDAAREDAVTTFNPLLHDTPAHGYFKTQRAGDCILRAWASQNIEEMPRLARWVFNAMWAAAQLGLTVADCAHLLMPGSPLHQLILARLPELLRAEWAEIVQARGGEAGRILESSRNRLKPFFDNPILRCIFGSSRSRLDILRFLREGRIVIINLSPQNRLSPQIADAIGGMILNELLAVVRSQPLGVRFPSYVWLDEFQRFVGPDIEEAIPEVRQLGMRLIMSHQSFSQLKRGDTDLTSLIWQAQSRAIMGVQGEDADILAHEVASLTFDPNKVKDEVYTRRQLLKEQRIIQLTSWSESESEAENWSSAYGANWTKQSSRNESNGWNDTDSSSESVARRFGINGEVRTNGRNSSHGQSGSESKGASESEGGNRSDSRGGSRSHSRSVSTGESILPVYDEFLELARKSYYSFEEQRSIWAKEIRQLQTGQALVRIVNDPTLYRVNVQRHAPGYLAWDQEKLLRFQPQAIDRHRAFVEKNYESDVFVSPKLIERETEERLRLVLNPVIQIPGNAVDRDHRLGNGNPLL